MPTSFDSDSIAIARLNARVEAMGTRIAAMEEKQSSDMLQVFSAIEKLARSIDNLKSSVKKIPNPHDQPTRQNLIPLVPTSTENEEVISAEFESNHQRVSLETVGKSHDVMKSEIIFCDLNGLEHSCLLLPVFGYDSVKLPCAFVISMDCVRIQYSIQSHYTAALWVKPPPKPPDVIKLDETLGLKLSFGASYLFLNLCSPSVCKNALMVWPSHSSIQMDSVGGFNCISHPKIETTFVKPPAKPPDDFFICAPLDVKVWKEVATRDTNVHLKFCDMIFECLSFNMCEFDLKNSGGGSGLKNEPMCLNMVLYKGNEKEVAVKKICLMILMKKKIDKFTLGEGVMPDGFKVLKDHLGVKESLVADFGGSAIGRVAPVDSGFWWIILLRAYTKCKRDDSLVGLPEVQTGMRLILQLCLSDGFDTFPTLLCPNGCSIIDRRMGVYGYPIEFQALFHFAMRCAREMISTVDDDSKELIERIDKRLAALSFHIQECYWLDYTQLNNIYRYKTEEYSHTAVNKFNVIPDSISDWVFDFMTVRGGYLIGNVSPARMDFRWFVVGNCIAILSSLATTVQTSAIYGVILNTLHFCRHLVVKHTDIEMENYLVSNMVEDVLLESTDFGEPLFIEDVLIVAGYVGYFEVDSTKLDQPMDKVWPATARFKGSTKFSFYNDSTKPYDIIIIEETTEGTSSSTFGFSLKFINVYQLMLAWHLRFLKFDVLLWIEENVQWLNVWWLLDLAWYSPIRLETETYALGDLADVRLVSLNIGSLAVAANYRGHFEDILRAMVNEVEEIDDKMILFIYEIQLILSARRRSVILLMERHPDLALGEDLLDEENINNLAEKGHSTSDLFLSWDGNNHSKHKTSTITNRFQKISYNTLAEGKVRRGAPTIHIAAPVIDWDYDYYVLDILLLIAKAIKDVANVLSASQYSTAHVKYLTTAISFGSFHARSHGLMLLCVRDRYPYGNSTDYSSSIQLFNGHEEENEDSGFDSATGVIVELIGKEFDLDGKMVPQGLVMYGKKGSTDQHAYIQRLKGDYWTGTLAWIFYSIFMHRSEFLLFSLPRPPEIDDLEDKVDFKGRGMMRINDGPWAAESPHSYYYVC